MDLRNIDPDLEQQLTAIGVDDRAALSKMGAQKVYQLLITAGHVPDMELYYRLVGALEDIDWEIVADREQRRDNAKVVDYDT